MIDVVILSSETPLFEGKASRVIFPGEQGIFEIGIFHRPFVSRLLPGVITIGDRPLAIRRGVVHVSNNRVIALVEPALT